MTLWDDLSPENPQFATLFVDRLLDAAIQRCASDVHLHPRSDVWEVLFRIDGVLSLIGSVRRSQTTDPVARLMVMARLPSYRAGIPQEGPLLPAAVSSPNGRTTGDSADVQMRLGTFPTVHGQRAVIRLLSNQQPLTKIADLGLGEDITRELTELTDCREGVILLAGPAGSGKTTTLYACLRSIAAEANRRGVLTIEDPIESVIDGISQSQLQPESGMTLAAALRSAVRQDPEVLLVSEIRDEETADAVLGASLTGHLCFSSVHASGVAGAVGRLAQMNLPDYLLRSGLLAICSQRLLRQTCDACRNVSSQASELRDAPYGDPDCERCHGVGYAGRLAIAQCVRFDRGPIGEAVLAAVAKHQSAGDIHRAACQAGMLTLAQLAWQLVEKGRTDEAEVYRVLGRHAGTRPDHLVWT